MKEELERVIKETFNGIDLEYTEVYHLNYEVDEESGKINKDSLVPYYTRSQMQRNLKVLKKDYNSKL